MKGAVRTDRKEEHPNGFDDDAEQQYLQLVEQRHDEGLDFALKRSLGDRIHSKQRRLVMPG